MNQERSKLITFEINKHRWVLLFQQLGSKLLLRAQTIKKKNKRVQDESGHRMEEVETEGGTKVKPKYDWDITRFPDK